MDALSRDPQYAESLRSALTEQLVAQGAIRSERVAAAFRAVPRHEFVPLVPLEVAYADDVVVMKRDEAGVAISSVSQPTVVAAMLEQAEVQPGHRVLEIGSGGYNAALLRELVGPGGAVTTIDIDQEVTDRARQGLRAAGYGDVRVVQTDGEFGCPESAPYDLLLVTATAWDIAPAWVNQLTERGCIVVPLRLRSQTRSIAFDRLDGLLRSRSMTGCGFVAMQGAGANPERVLPLHKDKVVLHVDDDQQIDISPLFGVLRQPQVEVCSGVLLDREESFSDLDLWLASTLPGSCVMSADRSAIESGLVGPALRWGGSAVVSGSTFGYLSSRPTDEQNLVEVGARANGPDALPLAERIVAQTRSWDADLRHGPGPVYEVRPAGTPDDQLPAGFHADRRHSRISIIWS